MFDKIKSEVLSFALKMVGIEEKVVRMFFETKPSNVNSIVIMPAVKLVMKKLVRKLKMKRSYGRVFNGQLNGVDVSLIRTQVGSPNAAIAMECLKMSKAKIAIRVDFCGGIHNSSQSIEMGDILIPKKAYCGDGVSPHYIANYDDLSYVSAIENPLPKFKELGINEKIYFSKPSEDLSKILLQNAKQMVSQNAKPVDLWTTDALFCEEDSFLNAMKSISVQGIDMESSIMFLLGKLFKIKTASILSVSDIPEVEKYNFLKSTYVHPNIEAGINKAVDSVINSLPDVKRLL